MAPNKNLPPPDLVPRLILPLCATSLSSEILLTELRRFTSGTVFCRRIPLIRRFTTNVSSKGEKTNRKVRTG